MALHKLLCGISLILVLQLQGCNAQLSVCGKAPAKSRIVGGQDTTPLSWPWQASIHKDGAHHCGGSLINKEWVLSAAHCFEGNPNVANFKIYLGRESQEGSNPNEVMKSVSQITCHPNYNSQTFNFDICLLKLSTPVTFNKYITPVCLAASQSKFYNGTDSWVTGWGTIQSGVSLPSPQTLQEVEVPVMGNKQCACFYRGRYDITEKMICAGLAAGGKDSCQGDSGGPMVVYKNSGQWILAGVVSFGDGCAVAGSPGVYARVSSFQQWIGDSITDQVGFVDYSSSGNDNDDHVCVIPPTQKPDPIGPTYEPMGTTTPDPMGPTYEPMGTTTPDPMGPTYEPMGTTTPDPWGPTHGPMTTEDPMYTTRPSPICDSLFCSGPRAIHFSYLTTVVTLVLMLYNTIA